MTKTGLETARPPQIERLTRGLDNADARVDPARPGPGEKKDDAFAALLKLGAEKVHRIDHVQRAGRMHPAVTEPVTRALERDGAAQMPEPDAAQSEALAGSAGGAGLAVPTASGTVLPPRTGPAEEPRGAVGTSQRDGHIMGPGVAPEGRNRDAQIRATTETAGAGAWLLNSAGRAPGGDIARHEDGPSAPARDHATSRSLDRLVSRLIEPELKPAGEVVRWSALKGEVVRQETHFPVVHPQLPDMRPVAGQVANALATMPRMGAGQSARTGLEPSTFANASPLRILELRLQPAELGTVRLQLLLKGEGLTLRVSALKAETAEMLQRDQSQIKDALRQAGVQVENVVFVKDAERAGGGPLAAQQGEAGRQNGDATPDQSMTRGDQMAGRDESGARGRAVPDEDMATGTPATDPDGAAHAGPSRDDGLYL